MTKVSKQSCSAAVHGATLPPTPPRRPWLRNWTCPCLSQIGCTSAWPPSTAPLTAFSLPVHCPPCQLLEFCHNALSLCLEKKLRCKCPEAVPSLWNEVAASFHSISSLMSNNKKRRPDNGRLHLSHGIHVGEVKGSVVPFWRCSTLKGASILITNIVTS